MELKDLVLGKKYKINKPEDIEKMPTWNVDYMDKLDQKECTLGEDLIQDTGCEWLGADGWDICPTWLTEVCEDTHESTTPKAGDFLKCVKTCYFGEDKDEKPCITEGESYEIIEASGNFHVSFINDLDYTHTWDVNDDDFEEYFTVIPKEEYNTQLPEVNVKTSIPEVKQPKTPVKSDGGSSDYYKLKMRLSSDQIKAVGGHPELTDVTFETGDVIRALVDNDFTLGNIIKAIRRIHQSKKGEGKQGVSVEYDCKKIDYFLKEWYDNYQKEQI